MEAAIQTALGFIGTKPNADGNHDEGAMAKKTDDTLSKVVEAVIIIATAIISLVIIVCLKPKNPMKVVQYVLGAIVALLIAYIVGRAVGHFLFA